MARYQLSSTIRMVPSVGKKFSHHGFQALRKTASYVTRSRSDPENSTADCGIETQLTEKNLERLPNLSTFTDGHSRSSSSTLVSYELTESDIDLSFANQGDNMVQQAIEMSTTSASSKSHDMFVRQMYIQGITFLLRGLPRDLTLDEELAIRGALPTQIVVAMEVQQPNTAPPQYTQHTADRSMLQRALSRSIVHGYLIARTIIPHVAEVSSKMYQYEKDHKIVTNAAVSGVLMADKVGRSGLVAGGKVLAMADTMVGGIVKSAAAWCLHGLLGGMHDAIGEVARLSTIEQQ